MLRIRTISALALLAAAPAEAGGGAAADCATKRHVVAFNGKAHQEIAFTYADCQDGLVFTFDAANTLTAERPNDPEYYAPTAQFFALAGQAPEARIRGIAVPLIAPEDKGRCELRANPADGTWSYTPVPDYVDALEANGLWGACGPYGDGNETSQFWMMIDGALIAYVSAGLEPPPFDATSFTYRNTKTPGLVE
jgi:hypothetical protein